MPFANVNHAGARPPAPRLQSLALLGSGALSLAACTGTITDDEDIHKLALAAEGRWSVPPHILDLGDEQDVSYTGAGPWVGSSSCSGGMHSGTAELRDFIEDHFAQVSLIGGYSCRSIVGNSSQMSVHGTGRALDIHIPTLAGSADNEAGDPIGNWLIANAEDIGIQYLIWDRTQWTAQRADGTKARRYNGAHPHHDHLHVELSLSGGAGNTSWFSGPQDPPQTPSCETIPATGGVIDNESLCLHLQGPSVYWRSVDGAGHESSLLWTNAFRSSTPSNWARWELNLEAAGAYEIEVFLDPEYAEYEETEYRVRSNGETSTVLLDQSSGDGWTSLGVFDFDVGGGQGVSVYDNTDETPGSNRSIMVDALRLSPID